MTAGTRWLAGMLGVALLVLSGCGPGGFGPAGSGGTGAIAVGAVWPGQPGITGAAAPLGAQSGAAAPLGTQIVPETAPLGVGSLMAVVYNGAGVAVATGGPWPATGDPACTPAPCASISGVPGGGPYTVTLRGYSGANGTGSAIDAGQDAGIMVSAGATTAAPAIVMASTSPTGLTVTPASGQITAAWNAVLNAASYNLYHSGVTPTTKLNSIAITGWSGTSLAVSGAGVTNCAPRYWVVTAVDPVLGESPFSAQTVGMPFVPAASGNLFSVCFNPVIGWVSQLATNLSATVGITTNAMTVDNLNRVLVAGTAFDATFGNHLFLGRWTENGAADTTFDSVNTRNYLLYPATALTNGSVAGNSHGQAITTDSKNRIVVAGDYFDGTRTNMAVWRFNADGTADSGFGTSGVVKVFYSAGGTFSNDHGFAVAVDSQGRIVVGGYSGQFGCCAAVVWRFLDSGAPDTNFGGTATTGVVIQGATGIHPPPYPTTTGQGIAGGSDDQVLALAIDSQDRILFTGLSIDGSGSSYGHMYVGRLKADGTADTAFGDSANLIWTSDGVTATTATLGAHGDVGKAIALDGSGRVLIAGNSTNASNQLSMATWRLTSSGKIDPSFNASGTPGVFFKIGTAGGTSDNGSAVAVDANGKIVVGGWALTTVVGQQNFAIWRLSSAGALDTSFANPTGFVTGRGILGGTQDIINGMTLDHQGTIVAAGGSSVSGNTASGIVVWEYLP